MNRQPLGLSLDLFAKSRTLSSLCASLNAMALSVNPSKAIPMDLWMHNILHYCDVLTLIRMSHVSKSLHYLMNRTEFVLQWQYHCSYLYRDCHCDRNLFYLDLQEYCDFLWEDVEAKLTNMTNIEYYLRDCGRSLGMLIMVPRLGLERLPHMDPTCYGNFATGVCATYLDDLIVPIPPMLPIPVEYANEVYSNWNYDATGRRRPLAQPAEDESELEFRHRKFWRNFHPIPYLNAKHESGVPPTSWPEVIEPDALEVYLNLCKHQERDPHDPNDDDDCQGHHTSRWIRQKMYETGVGNQQFPLDLCLHADELSPGIAQFNGVDYIERLFVGLHKWTYNSMLYETHGIIYTHGVRYNNEANDLVTWGLHTLALCHSMYLRLWIETMHRFTTQCVQFTFNLARDIQERLPGSVLLRRLQDLDTITVQGGNDEGDWFDNITDIHRKLFLQQARYQTYIGMVRNYLRVFDVQNVQVFMVEDHHQRYLEMLVPAIHTQPHANNAHRSIVQMVMDIYQAMDVANFMVDFAMYLGPPESPTSRSYRRTTLKVYLRWGTSLLMFNPAWKLDYDIKPSKANQYGPIRVPNVELVHNHRYQKYLAFLNNRILYHRDEWTGGYLPQDRKSDLNRYCTGPV